MGYRKIVYRCAAWAIGLVFLSSCTKSFDSLVEESRLRWYRAVCRQPTYREIQLVESIPVCGEKRSDWWGCYDYVSGLLRVSKVVPPDQVGKVLVHEMGHTLKPSLPQHLPSSTGIMYQKASSVPDLITRDDIDFICKEYDCPCRNPEKP